jgi:hypothetical protein
MNHRRSNALRSAPRTFSVPRAQLIPSVSIVRQATFNSFVPIRADSVTPAMAGGSIRLKSVGDENCPFNI